MDGIRRRIAAFMQGRYGTDKLNTLLLGAGVVLAIAGMLVSHKPVKLVFVLVSYGLMFWALFRCFSRQTYRRYQENRKFLQLLERLRDRQHRYFDCPKCRQPVRVPRGKGKIAISCPRCGEKFIKKT